MWLTWNLTKLIWWRLWLREIWKLLAEKVEANTDVDEKTAVPIMKSCDALDIDDGVEDVLVAGGTAGKVEHLVR